MNGSEWCKTCKNWRTYNTQGECDRCGRKLLRETSTVEMAAEWVRQGYVLE